MKNLYLFWAIVGFITPNILVFNESVETGNILLWLDPTATLDGMFGNRIAAAFIIDLLCVVLVALVWIVVESKRLQMKHSWIYIVLTLLFGLAGPLPLFLYQREKALGK
jgi:Terpene cyclase DEP1